MKGVTTQLGSIVRTRRRIDRRFLPALCAAMLCCVLEANGARCEQKGTLWAPYMEWTVKNDTYAGNPYDVVATVTFVHRDSGKQHGTEMFFVGDNTWKFRFTGTRTGIWNFITSSADADLDRLHGHVTVEPNPNTAITGFLTHKGNKFALQSGPDGHLKAFLFKVFQTDDLGPYKHTHLTAFIHDTGKKTKAYVHHAKTRGFTVIYIMLNHNLLKLGQYDYNHGYVNPDLTAFDILDTIITTTYNAGLRVHFWRWGDEERKWTPNGLPGGINGNVDNRITRYFAARLGPLPGWSIGYGFDLHEWVNGEQLDQWAEYFHEKLGWPHLLSARSFKFTQNPNTMISYSTGDNEIDRRLRTSLYPGYAEIVNHLRSDENRPHLYEERHLKDRYTNDDQTRRLLWRLAMAGGAGCWFGYQGEDPVWSSGVGYSNPEQLLTHQRFFQDRFLLDMASEHTLTGCMCLKSSSSNAYIFYKESTSAMRLDLSEARAKLRAVAVDTKKTYHEIWLGNLTPTQQIWKAPYTSDWAIAVGNFHPSAENR